ncbi:hypothetical protein [Nocardia alni]|uniref:hypothetical protein n=1 Tax=Nocardia alni TaxID=2815723 RepID=UPI001C23A469|nr:hypothetical protein [Nocardia alni]
MEPADRATLVVVLVEDVLLETVSLESSISSLAGPAEASSRWVRWITATIGLRKATTTPPRITGHFTALMY